MGKWMDLLDSAGEDANEGMKNLYWTAVKEMVTDALTDNFWDGLSLLWKSWQIPYIKKKSISNCLRDDIWELQALKEQVLNELMKTSIMSDYARSSQLWSDYQMLDKIITGEWYANGEVSESINLKKDADNDIWFPDSQNFYVDCPYGDFTQAWEDINRALKAFEAIGQGSIELGSFGSLAKVAEQRAIKRAQQWIKANQITLTIGGPEGSSPRSLRDGPGLAGLAADFKTEMSYVKNYGELVFTNTWKVAVGLKDMTVGAGKLLVNTLNIRDYSTAYKKAYDAKNLSVKQMETAIKFNLSLNNVAENSLVAIDSVLFETNKLIIDKFSKERGVNQNLQTFCEQVNKFVKQHCKNKLGCGDFSCK
jgi:hypothetical protein